MNTLLEYNNTFNRSDGDLMTVAKFLSAVSSGCFIDYDGFGYPVKDNKYMCQEIRPSKNGNDIPEDATHILWFNR